VYITSGPGKMKIRTLSNLFASITINLFQNLSKVAVFLYEMITIVTSYTSFDEGPTS